MKINIKALSAYLFTIGISVLFMLFLDGPGGSYLLIALILGLLLSVFLFLYTKQNISVSVNLSEDILNKGDELILKYSFRKRGILPTAFIKFSISNSVHFMSDGKSDYSVVIFAQDEFITENRFVSVFFGSGKVGTSEIIISDYLGIFSCKLMMPDLYMNIKIYPDIPDISNRDNFARALTDAVSFEDSEDTTQSATSLNGFPGYDHRKYIPGDNLKLINWKLSAKRGELLVRQLEGTGETEQLFVLIRDDLYFEESQFAAEAMLGMLMIFAKLELPARVIIYIDDGWEEICVRNTTDLYQLRYRMTDYYIFPLKIYCTENNLKEAPELRKITVPDGISADRAVVFAPVFDENIVTFAERLLSSGTEYQAAVCRGEITDKRIRKIERDNLSVRFSD